ncbi:hypothetical protein BC937DRAFT_95409 [Endogone sp. FLAS-F59071]|nr:hypothetical protein BC937DRAFT_95409 [Endogone sp. FLAS-F59071]|eukprot:RUS13386.1 hypothetical protein BC937DRAFT_95409 [Endogone sp. FLAS-F59071]
MTDLLLQNTPDLPRAALASLAPEIILLIAAFIPDFKDKCSLSFTCHRLRLVLHVHPHVWSPLDLSPYAHHVSNEVLFDILRKLAPLRPSGKDGGGGTTLTGNYVDRLDLSGCKRVESEAIEKLAKTFPLLKEIHLNVEPREGGADDDGDNETRAVVPGRQRTGVYNDWRQPSSSFTSSTSSYYSMFSTTATTSTTTIAALSSTTRTVKPRASPNWLINNASLLTLIQACGATLERLSLSGHPLSNSVIESISKRCAPRLTHLDISHCTRKLSDRDLQTLLSGVGPRLISLKMLGFVLSDLTLLVLKQWCARTLRRLHVSGGKALSLAKLGSVFSALVKLEDVRVNQIAMGEVDCLVTLLPIASTTIGDCASTLRHLDLSPKLDIFPSNNPAHTRSLHSLHSSSPHLTSTHNPPPAPSFSRGLRIEHHLHLTDASLHRLARDHPLLTTLRLVNPISITADAVDSLLRSLPCLRRFELRRWQEMEFRDPGVTAITPQNLPILKELVLYSVPVPRECYAAWREFKDLEGLEVWDAREWDERPMRGVMKDCSKLKWCRVGRTSVAWEKIGKTVLGGEGMGLVGVDDEVVVVRTQEAKGRWRVVVGGGGLGGEVEV